ncbi:MAG: Na+ driven multidrug efflux pump [uncultured Sulfurovum sp.]|uniref:Multidrug-efflux transporter n=1 Tax=uncultured Sulfurovum sp. TaxID=269237 RepID=A0A6S6SM27_9BACT|nr:MAG: Na+ driven multidrug efflux pump [uncultured Sulfurovum sp.]
MKFPAIDSAKHKKILKISLPAAFNSLLDMLQVITDLIMVGTISAIAVASVGLGLQALMSIFAILTLLQVGTNALISRFYGAKRMNQGSLALATLLRFALYFSVFMVPIWYFGANAFYGWMGVSSEVVLLGTSYVSILSIMIPFIMLKYVFVTALNATGDTTTPMYVKIVSIVLNVFLNYVLIFGHFGFEAMGVAGAAWATVTVNILELLVYVWLYAKGKTPFKPLWYFSKNLLDRALKVGLPATYERVLTVSSFMLFTAIIADYSTETLAGYQIGLRIEGLAFMPGIGFTITAMALMGQGLGAKKPEQSYEDVLLVLKYAVGLMFFLSFFMIFTPEWIVSFFTNDTKTIEEASLYLQIVGLSQIPLAFNFVLSGALRGAGDSKRTLRINFTSLWLVRIIPAFVLSWYFGDIMWVYIAMITDTFVKAFFLWRAFVKGEWKKIKV